ncbi:MAG: hypothetical protein JXB62_03990 [Pirellulales bacterium]|nr:hypothetical protein [Pirellulales bacterium]
MTRFVPPAMGWHRDLPDVRDFSPSHTQVAGMLKGLKGSRSAGNSSLPAQVDFARRLLAD